MHCLAMGNERQGGVAWGDTGGVMQPACVSMAACPLRVRPRWPKQGLSLTC